MTYNIRVGAGRENLLMPVKYLNSSGEKLDKIALAIKSVDPDYFTVLDVGLTPEEHREPSDHLAYFACVEVEEYWSDGVR